jgi:hypothetical protein
MRWIKIGEIMELPHISPGPILLFGSGETLPLSGKAYEFLIRKLPNDPKISILETPAGFELNSESVAGNIKDFLLKRLQNYKPKVSLIPARNRSSTFSTNDPAILEPILTSNWLLTGPGSPTYAVRQLQGSLAYEYIKAAHMLGSALTFASAALLAMSRFTLPVYEIYKAGEDLHWKEGLDYFSMFGLKLVFIPHWNNSDGGNGLDTSRCFMGKSRFESLIELLPKDITIIGIDEQTSLFFEFNTPCSCQVFGKGKVTILLNGNEVQITSGQSVTLKEIDGFCLPDIEQFVSRSVIDRFLASRMSAASIPSEDVIAILRSREDARKNGDWQTADRLREDLLVKGWTVKDTPDGPKLEPLG